MRLYILYIFLITYLPFTFSQEKEKITVSGGMRSGMPKINMQFSFGNVEYDSQLNITTLEIKNGTIIENPSKDLREEVLLSKDKKDKFFLGAIKKEKAVLINKVFPSGVIVFARTFPAKNEDLIYYTFDNNLNIYNEKTPLILIYPQENEAIKKKLDNIDIKKKQKTQDILKILSEELSHFYIVSYELRKIK
jgi:hypothetical protein